MGEVVIPGERRALAPKLAEQVARLIEDRIVAEGWSVGTALGKEADWTASLGVSRWTVREAERILELNGLIVSRRGGGGGMFVAAPVSEFVCNGLSHYLEYVRPELASVRQVWLALEALQTDCACDGLTDELRHEFETLAREIRTVQLSEAFPKVDRARALAAASAGNAATTLFTKALSRMAMHASWYSLLDDQAYHALFPAIVEQAATYAEALGSGDRAAAQACATAYVGLCLTLLDSSYIMGRGPSQPGAIERAYRLFPAIRPTKKADQVAGLIRDSIIDAGWPVGWNMGTEAELMKRYGVGRAVLREAIRSMEQLGVVKMGRGSSSGLAVIAPAPEGTIERCRRHLRRSGLKSSDAVAVRNALADTGNAEAGADSRLVELCLRVLDDV